MKMQRNILLLVFTLIASTCFGQGPYDSRRMILRDEGLSQLSLVDIANPGNNWYTPVPAGRDIQLVGHGLVMIGTGTGYEEREITTGKKVNEFTGFTNVISARRLRNGNTMLTGLNWEGKQGIVLAEVDAKGATQQLINVPQFNYVRIVRETPSGTFLVTSDSTVFETDRTGKILWKGIVKCKRTPHSWQALRIAKGQTIVSSGFAANFQIFAKDGSPVNSIGGPEKVHPHFFAGYQILKNGNMVVSNWQGHGPSFGTSGVQVLEFEPNGKLAWSWKQDPAKYSSIQGLLVLDGLNPDMLHVEDANGMLAPVKSK